MASTSNSNEDGTNLRHADYDNVLELLRAIYWGGVEREICLLILAYKEIQTHEPDLKLYEKEKTTLQGSNFRKFCDIWRELTRSISFSFQQVDLTQPQVPYVHGHDALDPTQVHETAIRLAKGKFDGSAVVPICQLMLNGRTSLN
jgi:hypothetical protein